MKTPTFNYKGLRNILHEKLTTAQLQIINNMKMAKKVASGNTIRSIKVETDLTDSGVTGSITAPMWSFITTETGRRSGKIPSNFISILYKWSIDKRIHFDKDYQRKSFAYLVARKIAKEGTLQHRLGKRTDIYTDVVVKIQKDLQSTLKLNDLFDLKEIYGNSEIYSIKGRL